MFSVFLCFLTGGSRGGTSVGYDFLQAGPEAGPRLHDFLQAGPRWYDVLQAGPETGLRSHVLQAGPEAGPRL